MHYETNFIWAFAIRSGQLEFFPEITKQMLFEAYTSRFR